MARNEVYFSNHGRALKFPWSLYHAPLIHSLNKFLNDGSGKVGRKILVIGPGDLPELPDLLRLKLKISILDIDPRVIDQLKEKFGDTLDQAFLVGENFENYPQPESFDLIYAKEVIEHFANPSPFVSRIFSLLRPGGRVWISTPNYGFFLLPFLESTILEIIARFSGFSRRNIHPSRFSRNSLQKIFSENKFVVETCEETFAKLALFIISRKSL